MKRLFFVLFTFLLSNSLWAQVKIVDAVRENISSISPHTIYAIKADQLKDNRIKITFRADTSGTIEFGQVYFNNRLEFDELYHIIMDGIQENKEQTIMVDIGNSRLAIHYFPQLFGSPMLQFSHSYHSALYQNKHSKRLSKKDINRLFDKN